MKIIFEKELQKKLLQGELDAFNDTVEICKDLVFSTSLNILKNRHDAEDVLQDVFTLLYHKRFSIDQETNIPVWLYKAAIFISKRHLTKSKIRNDRKLLEQDESMKTQNVILENESVDEELQLVLMNEISSLKDSYREVIVRHYLLGEKYKEIAHDLGLNLSTVSMQIKRGLDLLRKKLGKKGYVVPLVTLSGFLMQSNPAYASSDLSIENISSIASQSYPDNLMMLDSNKDLPLFDSYMSKTNVSQLKLYTLIILLGMTCLVLLFSNNLFHKEALVDKPVVNLAEPKGSSAINSWSHLDNNLMSLRFLYQKGFENQLVKTEKYILNKSGQTNILAVPYVVTDSPIKVVIQASGIPNQDGSVGFLISDDPREKNTFKNVLPIAKVNRKKLKKVINFTYYIFGKKVVQFLNNDYLQFSEYRVSVVGKQCLILNTRMKIKKIKITAISSAKLIELNQLVKKLVVRNK